MRTPRARMTRAFFRTLRESRVDGAALALRTSVRSTPRSEGGVMTDLKRSALVSSIERLAHSHGYSYVSFEDIPLIEELAPRGRLAIPHSARDGLHDSRLFQAACWALENPKIVDRQPRIYHRGENAHQIGIELFNGKTPRDDAALIILALKILESHGCKNWQLRVGNVDMLAQRLASFPYVVKHEVLRDLEELSDIDDRIHMIEGAPDRETEINAAGESISKWCTQLAQKTEREFCVPLDWNKRDDGLDGIKELFKEIKHRYVRDKWHETCGVSEDVGESLLDLLNLKWLPFGEARERLVQGAGAFCPLQETIEEVRQTVEDLRTLYPNGCTESQIVLDACLSHGLGYYSGVVFKIVSLREANHRPQWLCKGGRYDSLVADLVQRIDATPGLAERVDSEADIPANGFAVHVSAIAAGGKEVAPPGDGAP